MLDALREAYIPKKGACTLILHTLMLLLGVAGLRGDEDILQNCALWQEVVELEDEADRLVTEGGRRLAIKFRYILPIDLDNSRGGLVESADDIEQGALARTRWADDRGALADIEFEVDVLKDPDRVSPGRAVEGLGNFGELEDGHID